MHIGGWTLDRDGRRLQSGRGATVQLSDAEYRLLEAFLRAPQRVVSREQLMQQARGRPRVQAQRNIDLLVSPLRQKLSGADRDASLIRTVRGQGYRLDTAPGSVVAA